MAASDGRPGGRLSGQSDAQTIKLQTCSSGQVGRRDVGHFGQCRNNGPSVIPTAGVHQPGDRRANGSGDGHRRQPEPSRLGAGPSRRRGEGCWWRRSVGQSGGDKRRQRRFARADIGARPASAASAGKAKAGTASAKGD